MNRLTFWRLISSCALAAGCAESAIPADDEQRDEGTDSTGEGKLDAALADATTAEVDSGAPRRDAAVGADAAVQRDASLADAGLDASTPDAGRDAAVQDAGQPDTGTGPISCASGQTNCSNVCVNTTNDANNCGGCGMKCGSGQTCAANQCTGGEPQFNVPSGCTKKTRNQHGYAFCTSGRSWRDARNACIDAGLDLAIVTDVGESDFIKDNGDSWIALNDRNSEGKYKQVVPGNRDRTDGADATYFKWGGSEPNNDRTCNGFNIPFIDICAGSTTDEDCGMILSGGTWNDGACEESKRFVCETY